MSALEQRYRLMRRATLVAGATNVVLAAVQLAGGLLANSQALIADGLHTLSDLFGDAVVLLASRQATVAPDEAHPYGHGRIETLATVFVALLLLAVATGLVLEAARRLFSAEPLAAPHPMALLFAVVAILAKEGLFRYTRRIARRVRSDLLHANAWHQRSDVASSLVVLAGVAGALAGLTYLDALAAAIVGGMIAVIGLRLMRRSLAELIDRGLGRARLATLRDTIRSVDGVHDLHLLRTRRMGGHALVDVHVQLSPRISVSEAHYISERVRARLIATDEEVSDVTVHVDPEADDAMDEQTLLLPTRRQILNALDESWQGIEVSAGVLRVDLHYLGGRVYVEVYLSAAIAADSAAAQALAHRLQQAVNKLSYVADIGVWYSAP
ncbi:MAG: cation transporter [Gammaproteobacteria bacterium]|nr:cation transporter [Gammaproteobacteria bacterium]